MTNLTLVKKGQNKSGDLFSKFRNKDINLLEIGIGNGGSLKLWQKYFTGKSNIYCIDISFDEVTHKDLVSQDKIDKVYEKVERKAKQQQQREAIEVQEQELNSVILTASLLGD